MTHTRLRPRHAIGRLKGLVTNSRAVVALETALLFPILFLLTFGCWETYLYLRTASIVDRVSLTVADLVARKSMLYDRTDADDSDNIGAYYVAAEKIAEPLDITDGGTLILSAIYNDGKTSTITWQRKASFSGSASSEIGSEGQTVSLTNTAGTAIDLRTGETLIVAETFYPYTPYPWSSAYWKDAPLSTTLYRRAIFMARYGGINTLEP